MQNNTLFVRDYMMKKPIYLFADMGILQAISVFLSNKISGAPVVDQNMNLLGILTERDCIEVAVNAGYFDDFGQLVGDYMSQTIDVVAEDDNLMDVAQKLITLPYRRFPVVAQGRLVGLITRKDVLRVIELKNNVK